jgi:class 3 adenylate cyclase
MIRKFFMFFLFCMVFLLFYDTVGLKHDASMLVFRYSISIPFLAAFIGFSFNNNFFYYQQTSLSVTCLVFGMSVVIMETFKAPYPGYGLLLILFLVIFMLDSLFFLNRVGIVMILTIMYTGFLNLFCVTYQNLDNMHTTSPSITDSALKFNLSTIAENFCILQSESEGKELLYHNFLSQNEDYNQGPLDMAIYQNLWTTLENRQQVAPFNSLEQIILIFYFVALLVIPSWVSNYFSRVCFNRVQREYEMEKEGKVAQTRTREFLERLVPASIVPKLSHGKFIADRLDDVSILFVDMVGFTKFSSQLDPDELVMFLNEMYSNFDVVLEKYCLYKVEIIGDALFAVAGAPEDRYDKYHAARCVCAADGLLKEIIKLRNFLEISIRIRVGIHTGSCVAGIVGIKDPRYHLFGITSNYAEKMESTGAAGRVHVSQATMDSITKSGASQGITFTKREIDDLAPLPENASEEKKNKRQETVNNIRVAQSKVGASYFVEVNDEQVMTFPNLLEAKKGNKRAPGIDKEGLAAAVYYNKLETDS